MKQMIQLNEHAAEFAAAGIGLVAITYDAPELQQAFAEEHGITVPMLSDSMLLTSIPETASPSSSQPTRSAISALGRKRCMPA